MIIIYSLTHNLMATGILVPEIDGSSFAMGLGLLAGITLTIMFLDVLVYAQHYALHRVPILWRLHRTHHTDQDFDFTTGLRFHPVESILTTGTTLAAIAALGAAPIAVLLSQLLLIFESFFQHGNLRLPTSVD